MHWCFACMYINAPHACLVLMEVRSGHWIHWNWSCRWQMIVSYYVGTGDWTWVLKSSKYSEPLSHCYSLTLSLFYLGSGYANCHPHTCAEGTSCRWGFLPHQSDLSQITTLRLIINYKTHWYFACSSPPKNVLKDSIIMFKRVLFVADLNWKPC